jgi:hypothetical protein
MKGKLHDIQEKFIEKAEHLKDTVHPEEWEGRHAADTIKEAKEAMREKTKEATAGKVTPPAANKTESEDPVNAKLKDILGE